MHFSKMKLLWLFSWYFLLIGGLFAQNLPKDSIDIFKEGAPSSLVQQYEDLWQSSSHQEFWQEFQQKFASDFDPQKQYQLTFSQNIDTREIELFKVRNQQMEFLKSHSNFSKFSDAFKHYVENTIRWNYWYQLLNYAVSRSNADPKNLKMASLPNVMVEALDPKKIANEEAFLSTSYRDFLMVFVTYFNSRQRGFEKYTNLSAAMNDKAAFAKKYLSGSLLPYYLCRLLRENCTNTPKDAVINTLDELKRIPQTERYLQLATEKCQETLNRKEEIAATPTTPTKESTLTPKKGEDIVFQTIDGKPFYLSDFKGKVVYVDFWASWCGPCRKEFPYSKALHEKLTEKQQKKVVFLYISIDQSPAAWKQALQTLQLPGEHGHVSVNLNAQLLRKYAIESIPRYMIIDKKGNVVLPNAPRPSFPDTLSEILKLVD